MRRCFVLLSSIVAVLLPVRGVPVAAATTAWAGPVDGYRYVAYGGDPNPLQDELHVTIRFGGYQQSAVAAATYGCDGDFITAAFDCSRVAGVDLNSPKYPAALHSDSLASDDVALFKAPLSNGHELTCYGANGPSENLPEDQSSRWEIAGACDVR